MKGAKRMETNNNINNNKNNKTLIGLVIVLIIIIIGMGLYILYDQGVIFKSADTEINETNKNNEKENEEEDTEIKELDLTNCLNNSSDVTYSNASDTEGDYGLSMSINSDKKTITLSIDWSKFGPLTSATAYANQITTEQIKGFTKEVKTTFIGDLGQDYTGITLFYIMSDNTVEYTKVFKKNDTTYDINYTYDYSSDGKITGQYFETQGTISNAKNVIKLYNVSASNSFGWNTVIGAKSDGSFYDLGTIINNQ
jgi:hypothetical protein